MNKTKSLLVIVLILLVGVTSGYVANTYARYTAEVSKTATTAQVAIWNFEEDNASTTVTFNLGETYEPTSLVADRIAPGTCGSFDIELSNLTSETGVEYTIAFANTENLPTSMVFYADEDMQEEITPADGLTGQLAVGTKKTVSIYWDWDFLADDEGDTELGLAGEALDVALTITGVQTNPEEAIVENDDMT